MDHLPRIVRTAILLAATAAPLLGGTDVEGAKIFTDRCSSCHSIGGGDLVGPDLVAARRLTEKELRAALARMQESAGPLTADETGSLVALLKDPAANERVAGIAPAESTMAAPAAAPVAQPAGSAIEGRRLFSGERRLQNAGVACAACHTAAGIGGNLAADLTNVHARLRDAGLYAATERPAFPMMKGAYAAHAVTRAEADDIVAFLRSTAVQPRSAAAQDTRAPLVHATATGIAVAFFAALLVLFRSRPKLAGKPESEGM